MKKEQKKLLLFFICKIKLLTLRAEIGKREFYKVKNQSNIQIIHNKNYGKFRS